MLLIASFDFNTRELSISQVLTLDKFNMVEINERMLRTPNDVIDALGGTNAVAAIAGVTAPAVSNWRAFGFIPAMHFLVLSDELERRGLQFDRQIFSFRPAESQAS